MSFTVVEYYGKQNNSRCGYCKKTRSSSHGMHSYIMTAQDYQDLIDRGWRRSGLYCYKPNNKVTCCPSYTIKCDTQEFKLSKSHKKILRRMNKFLTDGIKEKDECSTSQKNDAGGTGDDGGSSSIKEEPEVPNIAPRNINLNEIRKGSENEVKSEVTAVDRGGEDPDVTSAVTINSEPSSSQKDIKKGIGPSDAKPPCKKAKQLRLERKKQKLEAKGISIEDFMKTKENQKKNQEKSLSDYINDTPENGRHKLKLKLVDVNSDEFTSTLKYSYGLYVKYQTLIHNDPPDGVKDYLYFLQRSALKNKKTPDGPSEGYGSFHQQYWLDDHLIAVGVIDILPNCISSVYFFYDPDYNFLSLGTYGSLREIDFTRRLSEEVPALKYYYMGFYIHSCPKMRYKGKLEASYLLCPEVYTWHLLTDELKARLDENKYHRFNEDPNARDENEFTEIDLDSVLVLVNETTYITYGQYKQVISEDRESNNILEYGRLVGKKCAHRMLYVH